VAVGKCDRNAASDVEAPIRIVRTIALDFIERGKDRWRIDRLVKLSPDDAVGGGHCGGINAEVEERRLNRSPSGIRQLAVDAGAATPVEARHQCAVEEDAILHGWQERTRLRDKRKGR
jgi:hypothetical protein